MTNLWAAGLVVVLNQAPLQWGNSQPFTLDAMHLELLQTLSGAEEIAPQTYLLKSQWAEATQRTLLANPGVRFAEPNARYKIDMGRSRVERLDPLAALQWAIQTDEGGEVHVGPAWKTTRGSAAIKVGVLDTGVDSSHPDMRRNLVREFNAVAPGAPITDEIGHGTHCAGVIGAQQGNGQGISGIVGQVSLIGIKTHDSDGYSDLATLLRGIGIARREGVRVVSASWGGGFRSDALRSAIAEASDILFVAASGNGGRDGVGDNVDVEPHYPSSYDLPNVLAVAAHGRDGQISDFSNFSVARPMITAPGVDILSAVPGGYEFMSGTSMATPHVTRIS
jgi:subtilisin family serine protease